MSYLHFLVLFVIGPTIFLSVVGYFWAKRNDLIREFKWHWTGSLLLATIAFFWTTPWDNYIVSKGVWSYGKDRVIGTLGFVPIEEYLFFVLMPLLNASLILFLVPYKNFRECQKNTNPTRAKFIATLLAIGIVGFGLTFLSKASYTYLVATLLWFTPPLWIQWSFNPSYLFSKIPRLFFATLIPTLYLSIADAWAIQDGIWEIHDPTRTGWEINGLPFEEFFFFFITSLLLAQGLFLWHTLRKI